MSGESAWDWQTDPLKAAAAEQLATVRLRNGGEAHTGWTPADAVAAMEGEATAERLLSRLREELADALDGAVDEEEAMQGALLRVEKQGRAKGFRACLRWLFQEGYEPGTVTRRAFHTVQELCPELVGGMSVAEMSTLFAETRSATDGRQMKMFRETSIMGRHRKRQSSVEKMRQSQKGNGNRRNGEKKRRVLSIGLAAGLDRETQRAKEKVEAKGGV